MKYQVSVQNVKNEQVAFEDGMNYNIDHSLVGSQYQLFD